MGQKTLLALGLSGCLLLTGCSALLSREYSSVTPHNAVPTAEDDSSTLRAESYQELVNALSYLVAQRADQGTVRLLGEGETVAAYLAAARQEVMLEDPLGSYSVKDIQYELTPVVSSYEANLHFTYRRTQEQVASIVPATGTNAIRRELAQTLQRYGEELVLRISYFEGDEAYIQDLARQAYYTAPEYALDFPEISVEIYPDFGRQRIVEISLHYHMDPVQLQARYESLGRVLDRWANDYWDCQPLDFAQALAQRCDYDPEGGSTAYHVLVERRADSQGAALALLALCGRLELGGELVEGTLLAGEEESPHFWTIVDTENGPRHLDPSPPEGTELALRTDREMEDLGYTWDRDNAPACVGDTLDIP